MIQYVHIRRHPPLLLFYYICRNGWRMMGTVVPSPLLLLRLKNNNNSTFSQRAFRLKPSCVPEDTEAQNWQCYMTLRPWYVSKTWHRGCSVQGWNLQPHAEVCFITHAAPPALCAPPRSIMSGLNALLKSPASLTFPWWAVIIIIAGAPKWIVLITRRLRSAINTVFFMYTYYYQPL